MTKHIEAKWQWLGETLVAGEHQAHILHAQEPFGLGHQAEEVRALIEAAPLMLSALKHLEMVISPEHVVLKGNVDFKDGALEVLRLAIAKATPSRA